jgi:hypothetical protein
MQSRLSFFIKALPLFILCLTASSGSDAQRVPASSSDSGRRAIVAIDQNQINQTVNNAQTSANQAINISNHAVNVGNNAASVAWQANDQATRAISLASIGNVLGEASWTNCTRYHESDCHYLKAICIQGFSLPREWNSVFVPPDVCGPNAGPWGFLMYVPPQTPP